MLKLYNTLARRVEPFVPIEPGVVKIYSCGPTVYRYIHIGNLRTFLMADWLRRTLAYHDLDVRHVKNITDVGHMRIERLDQGEDKLIAQARSEGKTSAEIAAFYTAAFHADEARFNILPAHVFPRATQHIAQMIAIIEGLERKGLAYVSGGNVFFDIRRYPDYGRLSGNRMAQLMAGVHDATTNDRRAPEDFALWKLAEPGREMAWDSPWGRGFPGWHIECSAMSIAYLGEQFDIHTGGVDNIFPHHEGEIAQSEGYTGRPFVRYWLHAQHLLADGQKMAKSTGNAYTLSDIEARGFDPLALRYLFTTAHYRSRINFTFTALRAAQTALYRLRAAAARLADAADAAQLPDDAAVCASAWRRRFAAEIGDDLNIPRAVAVVWDMLRGRDALEQPALKLALLLDFDRVLGLGLADFLDTKTRRHGDTETRRHGDAETRRHGDTETRGQADMETYGLRSVSPGFPVSQPAPETIAALVRERETLRHAGSFAEADALRVKIAAAGYRVQDTPSGPLVRQRALEEEFVTISRSTDVPDMRDTPDLYEFSVNLLARDNRDDLERCIASIVREHAGRSLEIVVVDNGSTDGSAHDLQTRARAGLRDAHGVEIPIRVFFADHNMGFAAGRNATMRASRGRFIILLDTSIELRGDIWTPLAHTFADQSVGLSGPYGLVTDDLREFAESAGPDVDAIEGYMMAFPRALLSEIGWAEEKFRFYRLLDIYYSFMFKTSGYRVLAQPELAELIVKHPHREWFSLTEEERAAKSKKNYDLFKQRWHHGQSLLVANFVAEDRWFGHDHPNHLGVGHTHPHEQLPPAGQPHSHRHQHWPDHDHEHLHYHKPR